jgi:malate dehydrogenase (oxaloacetate-decarboxylating)
MASAALQLHKKLRGKLEVRSKIALKDRKQLSLVYTPGVADVCRAIAKHPEQVYEYTIKSNSVAIVTDGSRVLGLGNIGPYAALPVMEGKAMLFKEFADINAFPICLATQDAETIINIVKNIAPTFGGINLEDIEAPKCFAIEAALQDIGIPVFHDDQHGTAIVAYAGMLNAAKVLGKRFEDLIVVVNGAGAAGTAIAKMLLGVEHDGKHVSDVIICDSKGILSTERNDLTASKEELARLSNKEGLRGDLSDALQGTDAFIGVSTGNILTTAMIHAMREDPIIFAMANPIPEITPEKALAAGAAIIATGRSDYPNQVNNVLAFPGVFRGALDAHAKRITPAMKIAAAEALARSIKPNATRLLPSALDKRTALIVGKAVARAWKAQR